MPDLIGKSLAGRALAAFVEYDEDGRPSPFQKGLGLFRPAIIVPARPALSHFDDVEPGDAKATPYAFDTLSVSFDQLPFGAALETAHGQQA
jgi:hypothetical protein